MSTPSAVDSSSAIVWAIWNDLDPHKLSLTLNDSAASTDQLALRRSSQEINQRVVTTLSATSRPSTEEESRAPPPGYEFPCRPTHYVDTARHRAKQNRAHAQYCSEINYLRHPNGDSLMLQAQPSILFQQKPYRLKERVENNGNTFLTEMPDAAGSYPNHLFQEAGAKICLPAFLPTIQAKTVPQKSSDTDRQVSAVRRYLHENALTFDSEVAAITQCGELVEPEKLSRLLGIEEMIAGNSARRTNTQRKKRSKSNEYRVKYKKTGSRSNRASRLYLGKHRDLTSQDSELGNQNRNSQYVYSDMVTHFSRISMRQVQATLNSAKSSLPNI